MARFYQRATRSSGTNRTGRATIRIVKANRSALLQPINLTIYALATDAAAMGAFLSLRTPVARLLGTTRPGPPTLGGIALFSGGYVLFLIAFGWLRSLRPQTPGDTSQSRAWLTAQGLSLAALTALALADLSGFLATIFSVNFGDVGEAYYFLITPAVFIVIGLLYLLVLVSPNEPSTLPHTSAYTWRAIGGLLGVNLFTVVVAILLGSLWAGWVTAAWVRAALEFGGLGWLLALPRQVYVGRSQARLAWLSWGLLMLGLALLAV